MEIKLHENIKALRKARKMTQEQLETTIQTIIQIENNLKEI